MVILLLLRLTYLLTDLLTYGCCGSNSRSLTVVAIANSGAFLPFRFALMFTHVVVVVAVQVAALMLW